MSHVTELCPPPYNDRTALLRSSWLLRGEEESVCVQLPNFPMKLVESTGNFDVKFKNQICFSRMPIMTISLRTQSESEKYHFVASPVYVRFCNILV